MRTAEVIGLAGMLDLSFGGGRVHGHSANRVTLGDFREINIFAHGNSFLAGGRAGALFFDCRGGCSRLTFHPHLLLGKVQLVHGRRSIELALLAPPCGSPPSPSNKNTPPNTTAYGGNQS